MGFGSRAPLLPLMLVALISTISSFLDLSGKALSQEGIGPVCAFQQKMAFKLQNIKFYLLIVCKV